ncbi:unnamed protein product [marine sediment metagenome]|uniref:Uncharacterized protein n=1 Tax=marine sediment metagenome TaxID=412755 RepID=X1UDU3_9ZZZZ
MITKPTLVGARWDAFVINWDRRLTEYALNKSQIEAELWILTPEIFIGRKTWEELRELYSEKDGAK